MIESAKEAAKRLAAPMFSKGFEAVALHRYTDQKGEALYFRMRMKHPETGEKWIRPFHLVNDHGFQIGEPKFSDGKPLYRLSALAANPGAPCWYVEGENCADEFKKLGLLCTTAGGAQSESGADFKPLSGRAITIWPDKDVPGLEHAERVAAKLQAIGCNVEVLDVTQLELPEGGDVVDWLKLHPGATPADLAKLPRKKADAQSAATAQAAALSGIDSPELVSRCFADIELKPIRWLWRERIARGKPTVIAGDPGLGKSQLTVSLAAIVTTGGRWPVDRTPCEKGRVVFLSAEDDPEDTLGPRLKAAGADLSLCHFIPMRGVKIVDKNGNPSWRFFDLKRDMRLLSDLLAKYGDVALVVIDPITAYMGDTNSHVTAEVRGVLAELAETAGKSSAAFIAVSHLNKGESLKALHRVTGSLAFVAAARAAFLVTPNPENEEERLFVPMKNNIGPDSTGYSFRVEGKDIGGGIKTSAISWGSSPVDITANEALETEGDEHTGIDAARAFLEEELSQGAVPTKQVKKDAVEAGHSWRTINRAKEDMGIEARKRGEVGKIGYWEWRLPVTNGAPKNAKKTEECQPQRVAPFEEIGILREPSADNEAERL